MKNGISHFHISCLPEVRTFPTIGVAAAGNGSRPDGPCGAVPIASIFELNASIGVLALAHPPRPIPSSSQKPERRCRCELANLH